MTIVIATRSLNVPFPLSSGLIDHMPAEGAGDRPAESEIQLAPAAFRRSVLFSMESRRDDRQLIALMVDT